MTHDPQRLVDMADAPEALREALDSARELGPGVASAHSILQGVLDGLDLPPGGGPNGGPPEAPPDGPAPPVDPSTVAQTSSLVTTAWVGSVVTVGAIVAAVVVGGEAPERPSPAPAPTVSLSPIAPTAAASTTPTTEEPAEEEPAEEATTAVEPPPAAPTAAPVVPSETELLDAAQQALANSREETLRLCGEHAKHHPRGALSQERDVLIIEALVGLGRTGEASARAEQFRRAYPGSGHLRRIDLLVGRPED